MASNIPSVSGGVSFSAAQSPSLTSPAHEAAAAVQSVAPMQTIQSAVSTQSQSHDSHTLLLMEEMDLADQYYNTPSGPRRYAMARSHLGYK